VGAGSQNQRRQDQRTAEDGVNRRGDVGVLGGGVLRSASQYRLVLPARKEIPREVSAKGKHRVFLPGGAFDYSGQAVWGVAPRASPVDESDRQGKSGQDFPEKVRSGRNPPQGEALAGITGWARSVYRLSKERAQPRRSTARGATGIPAPGGCPERFASGCGEPPGWTRRDVRRAQAPPLALPATPPRQLLVAGGRTLRRKTGAGHDRNSSPAPPRRRQGLRPSPGLQWPGLLHTLTLVPLLSDPEALPWPNLSAAFPPRPS
jgi:hypothetical protein